MEMDVAADIRAPDSPTLDLYCDRVASAVGRLSVRVFGMDEAAGVALAHHLGRALQLTNILRDLDEDAAIGRLYLPREALRAAGIAATIRSGAVEPGARRKVCAGSPGGRAGISPKPTRSWRSLPAPHGARAAHHGGGLPRLILDAWCERGWSPARADPRPQPRALPGSSCATPSS